MQHAWPVFIFATTIVMLHLVAAILCTSNVQAAILDVASMNSDIGIVVLSK